MEIKGYKAFHSDMTNCYGFPYEEGQTYEVTNGRSIAFGVQGNGFHYCKRLEDTLRYFPEVGEEIKIAEVTGRGTIVEGEDDYYGYYDMYASQILTIDRILPREEILELFLSMNPNERVKRFIMGFKMNTEELARFRERFVTSQEKTIRTFTPDNRIILDYVHIIKEIDKEIKMEELKQKVLEDHGRSYIKRKPL